MVLELKYLVLCRPETSNNPVTFLAGTTHFFLGGTQLCLEAPTWAWRYPLFMGRNSRDTILIGYWYPPFCTHWVVRLGRNRRCPRKKIKPGTVCWPSAVGPWLFRWPSCKWRHRRSPVGSWAWKRRLFAAVGWDGSLGSVLWTPGRERWQARLTRDARLKARPPRLVTTSRLTSYPWHNKSQVIADYVS